MEQYCCEDMMAARTFDGPFLKDRLGWAIVLWKLTPRKRSISVAKGARKRMPVFFCPWCGGELGGEEEESSSQ